jgi:hypothetical protein
LRFVDADGLNSEHVDRLRKAGILLDKSPEDGRDVLLPGAKTGDGYEPPVPVLSKMPYGGQNSKREAVKKYINLTPPMYSLSAVLYDPSEYKISARAKKHPDKDYYVIKYKEENLPISPTHEQKIYILKLRIKAIEEAIEHTNEKSLFGHMIWESRADGTALKKLGWTLIRLESELKKLEASGYSPLKSDDQIESIVPGLSGIVTLC